MIETPKKERTQVSLSVSPEAKKIILDNRERLIKLGVSSVTQSDSIMNLNDRAKKGDTLESYIKIAEEQRLDEQEIIKAHCLSRGIKLDLKEILETDKDIKAIRAIKARSAIVNKKITRTITRHYDDDKLIEENIIEYGDIQL